MAKAAVKGKKSNESANVCRLNTDALKRVNQRILRLLDRLPLEKQSDVVTLNRLIDEQERLIRVHVRGRIPCRVSVFNENERYRAVVLRQRYSEAHRTNRIRKPQNEADPAT